MSAGAIGGLTNPTNSASASNGFAQLSSEEFVQIMLTELSNQDPFEPQDSAAIFEQLGSLRDIETQMALQEDLEAMVLQNSVASAGGMIGQLVKGLTSSNQQVEGIVTSLKIEDGRPVLQLDSGQTLEADRVTEVQPLGDFESQLTQGLLNDLNLLQTSELIGKSVTGRSNTGVELTGIVQAVRIVEGNAVLELEGGSELPVSNVLRFGPGS